MSRVTFVRRFVTKQRAFVDTPSWSTKESFGAAQRAAPVSHETLVAVADAACLDVGQSAEESEQLRRDLGQMIGYVQSVQAVLAERRRAANAAPVEPLVSVAPTMTSLVRAPLFAAASSPAVPSSVVQRDELLRQSSLTKESFYAVPSGRSDEEPID